MPGELVPKVHGSLAVKDLKGQPSSRSSTPPEANTVHMAQDGYVLCIESLFLEMHYCILYQLEFLSQLQKLDHVN